MKNQQLQFDLERLLSYDEYCYSDITTDYVEGEGYVLDIKDNSYFYDNEEDRDFDDKKFMELVESKFYM